MVPDPATAWPLGRTVNVSTIGSTRRASAAALDVLARRAITSSKNPRLVAIRQGPGKASSAASAAESNSFAVRIAGSWIDL